MKPVVIALFLSLVFFSCEEEKIINEGPLTGYWVLSGYQDNVTIMQRANGLAEDAYSFGFAGGGRFIEHKNAGWCGTPPIAYADFEGKWEISPDSVVNVRVGYWGGTTSYSMKIVSLDQSSLKYISHYE